MQFDLDQLETSIAYKLLAATVMPRPIAWVVTESEHGLNAAPYSFFNVMGSDPPTVAIGLLSDPDRGFKDTASNILSTGEFVVNLVPERLVEAMNITAVNAPAEIDELALTKLSTTPSRYVTPPRISESPVAFECRSISNLVTGPKQTIVIGRVLSVYVEDDAVLNAEQGHIDTPRLDLVARSYGSDYVRSRDTFVLDRPVWGERDFSDI